MTEQTAGGLPGPRSCLVERVSAVAARRPGARAVTGAAGALRYRDVEELRRRWAARLAGAGAAPGSLVALDVRDPLFLAPAFLAVRTAGLVPLPLDPGQPAAHRAAVLAAARPALTMEVTGAPECREVAGDPLTVDPAAGYVAFTSGAQGAPKGIVANERGALHFVDRERETLGLRPGVRVAQLGAPGFEVTVLELFVALCAGGESLAAPPRVRAEPAAVPGWLAGQRAELVHTVPSLSARWVAAAPETRLPGVRWTLFAGEPLHAEQVLGWRRSALSTAVINLYGPAETTLANFWYEVPGLPRPGLQPVGQALPGTRLRTAAPPGVSFPVTIETPYGSLGYLPGGASDADEAALTRSAGVTVFASQDLGVFTGDGELMITGRAGSLVERHGAVVDLAGIEAAAVGLPGVRLACCLQAGPETGGALVLFVEPAAGLSAPGATAVLGRRLRRDLGPGAPDEVVALDRMPLCPNGKTDRRAVAGILTAGPPGAAPRDR